MVSELNLMVGVLAGSTGGVAVLGSVGTLLTSGTVALCSLGTLLRRTWSSTWSWCTSLSVRGANGELAVGFSRAWVRSWAAARTRSVEEAVGMVTCLGNHSTVSMMRVALVSMIQME